MMDASPATVWSVLPSVFLDLIVYLSALLLHKLPLELNAVVPMMPKRISFDDSALCRSWLPGAIMPGSFDDEWIMPTKVRRVPTPWESPRESDDDKHDDEDHSEAMWTLPPSPLDRFANIHVTLDDIKEHVTSTQPRPSRISLRSVSVSSTTSLDSISTLLSDLDESIASWQTCSDTSTASVRSLRRRRTPRVQSLRDVRTKQSEMQLQKAYEDSAQSYLDDSIYSAFKPPALRPRNPARLHLRYSV